jgi:hypothetical protein
MCGHVSIDQIRRAQSVIFLLLITQSIILLETDSFIRNQLCHMVVHSNNCILLCLSNPL